jgi:hypothetical protein
MGFLEELEEHLLPLFVRDLEERIGKKISTSKGKRHYDNSEEIKFLLTASDRIIGSLTYTRCNEKYTTTNGRVIKIEREELEYRGLFPGSEKELLLSYYRDIGKADWIKTHFWPTDLPLKNITTK